MNLADHFRANLSSDLAAARRDITRAVLADTEAVRQLEADTELWLKLPAEVLSSSLSQIYSARQHDTDASAWRVRHMQTLIGQSVESLYMRALDTWLDAELADVDFAALAREENIPEPGDAA